VATAGILLGDDIYVSMCYRSKTKMISNVLLRAVTFIFRCYGIRKFNDQEALTLLVFQMLRYLCLASVLGYMMYAGISAVKTYSRPNPKAQPTVDNLCVSAI